ncbi:MAG: c-type cytochrome [Candidatus Rokubacteria bacterium]|nr:c-type cytochrome [Candidatus Rokubacteria bacterium]
MTPTGLIVALLLVLPGFSAAQPLFTPTQDPLAGSRVFGAKGCVKCHAISGSGGKVGPDLARIPRPRSFYDLAAAMWNHAPRMAQRMADLGIARPQLDARETGDLVAFLFTLDYFDPRGNEDAGRRLFGEKRCVVCHQVGGVGGVVGPPLDALKQYGSPIYLATAMWNHGPQMAEVMKAKGIARPTFKDADLRDLIAYINAASPVLPQGPLYVLPGRPVQGRILFAQKRCIECHAVGGLGGRVGPDLAERGLHRSLSEFTAAMWNKAPAMMDAMKARAVPVPQLKPEEMADIVAYLYSVGYFAQAGDPKNGAAVATSKGCLGCHGLHGERGKVAGDLARAKGLDSPAAVLSALWNHAFIKDPRLAREKAAWPELRPAEMADLVAFLLSLRRPGERR